MSTHVVTRDEGFPRRLMIEFKPPVLRASGLQLSHLREQRNRKPKLQSDVSPSPGDDLHEVCRSTGCDKAPPRVVDLSGRVIHSVVALKKDCRARVINVLFGQAAEWRSQPG